MERACWLELRIVKIWGKIFSYPNNFCLFYIAVVMDGCIIVFLEFFMQSNSEKTNEKSEKRTQTEES